MCCDARKRAYRDPARSESSVLSLLVVSEC